MKETIKTQYDTVKVSFGIYIIGEVRKRTNKEYPTETDIKKMLLKTGQQSAVVLSAAKQISRYCKTNHDYLLKAKEETFNIIAQALHLPIQHFNQFHEHISQLYNSSSNYHTYLEQAENYLLQFKAANDEVYFKRLLNYQEDTGIKTILINYPFGELDHKLPATHFGAYTDIKTEIIFKQLCARMNVTNYKIVTDTAVAEQFEKQNKKRQTWVNIGLFGNRLTTLLLTKNLFGDCFNCLPQQNKIVLMGREYAANREKKIDYGVFARIQLKNRKTIILVGGIEGYGTEKTGEYIWRNWRKMYDIITNREAASVMVLFKIFNGKIKQQTIVDLP